MVEVVRGEVVLKEVGVEEREEKQPQEDQVYYMYLSWHISLLLPYRCDAEFREDE